MIKRILFIYLFIFELQVSVFLSVFQTDVQMWPETWQHLCTEYQTFLRVLCLKKQHAFWCLSSYEFVYIKKKNMMSLFHWHVLHLSLSSPAGFFNKSSYLSDGEGIQGTQSDLAEMTELSPRHSGPESPEFFPNCGPLSCGSFYFHSTLHTCPTTVWPPRIHTASAGLH